MRNETFYYQFVWKLTRGARFRWFLVLITSFAWILEVLFWPDFLGKIVDVLTTYQDQRLFALSSLKWLLWIGACLWIFMEVCFRFRDYLLSCLLPLMEATLRMEMFDHIQRHLPKYFQTRFAGNLGNKISDVVLSSSTLLRDFLMLIIPGIAVCVCTVILFFTISIPIALIIVIWMVVHFAILIYSVQASDRLSFLHGENRSFLNGKIVDSLSNYFIVNLFHRFDFEKRNLRQAQEKEQIANHRAQIYSVKVWGFLCFVLAVEMFVVVGTLLTFWSKELLSTGQVVQGFYTVWNVTMVMLFIADRGPEFFRCLGLAKQGFELMKDPQDVVDVPLATSLEFKKGDITFDKVSFSYGKKQILSNQTLQFPGGKKIGLVGYSGAGKSTITQLILRFLQPDSGSILIDGQDISQVKLESLRRHIILVPQDPYLFHRSIFDNICYGKEDATLKEVMEVAKKAHCHEFIEKCAMGYDTLVGERGIKLSGGEKQRISIARAMLSSAPILILDEATSSLDSLTETVIQTSLDELMSDRTALVIAHRLSTLSKMDEIFVFEHGAVIERGSHEDLVSRKHGLYASMWKKQVGGFLPPLIK